LRRRAQFQFGKYASPWANARQVDTGLGKALAIGTISLIPPNDVIKAGLRDPHYRRRGRSNSTWWPGLRSAGRDDHVFFRSSSC